MCEVESKTGLLIKTKDPALSAIQKLKTCAQVSDKQLCSSETVTSTTCSDELLDLPLFLEEYPRIWFAKLEAIFLLNLVTSEDFKFSTVVGSLDPKILRKVREAVTRPPNTGKYENLKKSLLETLDEENISHVPNEELFKIKAKLIAEKILRLVTEEADLQSDLTEFGEEFQKLWNKNGKLKKFVKQPRKKSFDRVKPCSFKRK